MERCWPIRMKKMLEVVKKFKDGGVEFIPIPVLSVADREFLQNDLQTRMDVLIRESENSSDVNNDVSSETIGNIQELEAIDAIKEFLSPKKVLSISKNKKGVFAFCELVMGSEMIRVPFDQWPNCELANCKVTHG